MLEPGDAGGEPLALTLRAGRALLPPGQTLEMPVVIDVTARPRALERPPLDLSLVIDKSGSMKEQDKIGHALEAARLLVENLSGQDSISIVAYDEHVVVLDAQQPAVQKRFLAHWMEEIEPGGYTNLSGGLLAGLQEIRRGRREDSLARVLLLTDGLANRGVTTAAGLRSIAEAARKEGITVSTIGVGTSFDEGILTTLAEAGGGHYTYVPEAEAIPGAVAQEVEGLLPVVCQNLRLRLQLAEGVELVEPVTPGDEHAGEAPAPIPRAEDLTIDLGDLVPEERRTCIVKLRIAPGGSPDSLRSLLAASAEYQLPEEAGRSTAKEGELALAWAESAAQSDGSIQADVADTAWLAEVLDLAYLALESGDRHLAEQARLTIGTYHTDLDDLATRGGTAVIREHAALLAHYGEELARLATEGRLHEHEGAESFEEVKKDIHYRRYLLLHHRPKGTEDHHHP